MGKKLNVGLALGIVLAFLVSLKFLAGSYTTLSDSLTAVDDYNTSVANESFTCYNATDYSDTLGHSGIVLSTIYIINASNSVVIGRGNFTTQTGGYIALASGCTSLTEGNCSLWNNTAMYASYSYETGGIPILKAIFGDSDRAGFIMIGAVILIGILAVLFAYYKRH